MGDESESNWKKFPDLIDNLEFLLSTGFTRENVGTLYLGFLVESHDTRSLAIGRATSVKDIRKYQRHFQEATRRYVSDIKALVKLGGQSAEEILSQYNNDGLIAVAGDGFGRRDLNVTIDNTVHELIRQNRESALLRIAHGLIKGSRRYMQEVKGMADTPVNPALFKEYNDINASLKRYLKDK